MMDFRPVEEKYGLIWTMSVKFWTSINSSDRGTRSLDLIQHGRGKDHQAWCTDPDEDTKFKLAFMEALGDAQVAAKLTTIMRAANKDLVDQVASLREEVRGLKTALADRDATIAQLQGEVRGLRLHNDALEQYGRRSSLRITGISEDHEDTTAAVVSLANEVLQLDPNLE